MSEGLQISQQKAKKVYICSICGKEIWKDTEYVKVSSKGQTGKWTDEKRHIHCDAALQAYRTLTDAKPEGNREREIENLKEWARHTVCPMSRRHDICQEHQCFENGDQGIPFECMQFQSEIQCPGILRAVQKSIEEAQDISEMRRHRK